MPDCPDRRSFMIGAAAGVAAFFVQTGYGLSDRQILPTGYVFDKRYLDYQDHSLFHESPRRLETVHAHLERTGLLEKLLQIHPKEDILDIVKLVHTQKHICAILRTGTAGKTALLAAGGVIAAVNAVHSRSVRNAFCAVRPPGHHAMNTGREEGFCYYNNIAIGTRYAQYLGYKRVIIIDWDFHHGNGTEGFFYDDESVLYFSTHTRNAYPGTGSSNRTGKGAGKGTTINVPLRCGTGDKEMLKVWRETLLPAAELFKPDFILISAGFDSKKGDPLGCFDLTDAGFAAMTAMAMDLADRHCEGRIVSALEGGYDPVSLAEAVAAHVQMLMRRS